MRSTLVLAALAALSLAGCGTLPGGFMSPGTQGAPSTGTTLAQTARDQSTVPGTSTGGTASGSIYNSFAAVVPAEVALEVLRVAAEAKWTPEQIDAIFRGLAAAPQSVHIEGAQSNQVNAGDAENLGAGTGGSGAASGGAVTR